MEFYPLHLLLSRLEEEIEFQQRVTTTYLVSTPKYSPETVASVQETIRRISADIKLISLILGELEEIQEKDIKEEALILSSESLSLVSLLLPAVERYAPFFLENLRIENKPLLEKLEEILEEIENALEKLELSSSREIIRTLEDLAQSLEISLLLGERIIEREA
ncbi:MAG: hypothetical protein DSY42_04420 [Aquifex sp.]|nr:MAG: hypothetical protein DSY42_04420 [Aquifex sp.]